MNGRLLAVNVGNTRTTFGLFDGDQIRERWTVATRVDRTADELFMLLRSFLVSAGRNIDEIGAIGVSLVVPDLNRLYCEIAHKYLHTNCHVVSHTSVQSMKIAYDPPEAVGPDRLCGVVAGFAKYGGPLIVADLGTASVFDVVTADGTFRGGVIAPGIRTAMEALHSGTAVLPSVDLEFPADVIGSSTRACIQSGVMFGAADSINGILQRLQTSLGGSAIVVGTGGFSSIMQLHCPALQRLEPDLVLDGIRILCAQA